METRINIAEILRNKPSDIRLYSPIFGNCTFCYIKDETSDICVRRPYNEMSYFNFEGLYNTAGECLLFPSKEMRDWSKFAWKKGDILVGVGQIIIFEKFIDENYTEFQGKYSLSTYEDRTLVVDKRCYTSYFRKLDDSVNVKNYFKEIEERLGGKLNRETLEVEKAQPKFQDGDILFVRCDKYSYIEIFNYFKKNGDLYDYASLNITRQSLDTSGILKILKEDIVEIRLATGLEKQQLFSALEKEGKAWDAEKKQIMDLKPKWTPKPFDRVITRNDEDDIWTANIFSHMDSHGEYVTIGCVGGYTYCIPYNKETAKLIGTTNNMED